MVQSGPAPVPSPGVDDAAVDPRWRGVVIAAVALGLFCAVLLACWIVAGQRIDGYHADVATWVADDRPDLLAASDAVDPAAFPIGEDVDLASVETLASQAAACERLSVRRVAVARAVEQVPVVYSGPLGVVRPALRSVAEESRERRALVERLGERAETALAQAARDCAWSAQVNTAASKAQRYWAEQAELEDPYATEGAIQCRDEAGCVPSDLERRETYVDLAEKALTERALVAELQAGDACRRTSYGEGCTDLASSTAAEVKAWRAWYAWLSSTTAEADIPGFDDRSARRDELVQDAADRAREALRERFADAGLVYAAKEPRWVEGFFTDMAERRLAALRPLAGSVRSID